MSPSTFLERLLASLAKTGRAGKRHIIWFASEREYVACARLIRQQRKSSPLLRQVKAMPLIRSLSCPLSSSAKLRMLPYVRSVEPDIRIKVHAYGHGAEAPALTSKRTTTIIPWGVKQIGAPKTWPHTLGHRVRIGVIDTGVDFAHPDLRHTLGRGFNAINRHMLPIDDNGHGTHICGTIAAQARSGGIIGVAPGAQLFPVKAFDHQGSAFVSDIIKGIEWCVQNDIHVINMSFGMKTYSKALEAAVRSAVKAGLVIVASSGNDGKSAKVDYPARFGCVITVGATNRKGQIAAFSNAGDKIDIFAPGERIYSTWLQGKYMELSGTSMATSHVSGVVALLLSRRPGLTPQQIKALLKRHARWVIRPGQAGGTRELQALRVVNAVMSQAGSS